MAGGAASRLFWFRGPGAQGEGSKGSDGSGRLVWLGLERPGEVPARAGPPEVGCRPLALGGDLVTSGLNREPCLKWEARMLKAGNPVLEAGGPDLKEFARDRNRRPGTGRRGLRRAEAGGDPA